MSEWLEENWGWIPPGIFLSVILTWAIWASVYHGKFNHHNERMCNSVGGTWLPIEGSFTCARVTPIPFPNPRTPLQ